MGPGIGQQGPQPEEAALFLVIVLVFLAGLFGTVILFLMTMYRTLDAVRASNRAMDPGKVWLMLIPYWNLVWFHMMAHRIPKSIEQEYEYRGLRTEGEGFGKVSGQIWATSSLLEIFAVIAGEISESPLAAIATVVCSLTHIVAFVVFWVQIAGYRKVLADTRSRRRRVAIEVEEGEEWAEVDRSDSRAEPRRRKTPPGDDYDDDLARRARG